jgi:hypothetical protein
VAKVNKSSVDRQFAKLETALKGLTEAAYKEFVKNTPVRSGNARRRTRLDADKIIADYPYSQRLEDGYSSQARRGMIEPTEQFIQQEVERRTKGL